MSGTTLIDGAAFGPRTIRAPVTRLKTSVTAAGFAYELSFLVSGHTFESGTRVERVGIVASGTRVARTGCERIAWAIRTVFRFFTLQLAIAGVEIYRQGVCVHVSHQNTFEPCVKVGEARWSRLHIDHHLTPFVTQPAG